MVESQRFSKIAKFKYDNVMKSIHTTDNPTTSNVNDKFSNKLDHFNTPTLKNKLFVSMSQRNHHKKTILVPWFRSVLARRGVPQI